MLLALHPQPLAGSSKNAAISTASADVDVEAGRAYRVIATADCYIRLQKQSNAAPATSADILLPARTPMILLSNGWDRISAITLTGAGQIGVIGVQAGTGL